MVYKNLVKITDGMNFTNHHIRFCDGKIAVFSDGVLAAISAYSAVNNHTKITGCSVRRPGKLAAPLHGKPYIPDVSHY
uniref:Uncharacterized protein n=1 Tax=Candidatus Methanogaster sp. ANME-2c ERB4 TaxID=2759911 RepID=A0A7G9YG04_9EURY|nr:hypothetical protein GBMLOPDG_00034 [Methanosarcinales archaeon ANME-2c ERB4]